MKKNDQLFELIDSMSKAEKRHFKLYSSFQSGSKNYVELFSFIDRQVAYNEDKIRKRFEGEKFLIQLHVTKNYLYKLILKSLESLHQNKSVKAQVPSLVNRISILSERELYNQAAKLLKKAMKMASEQELLTDLLKLYQLKGKIDLELMKPARLKDVREEDSMAIARLLKKLSREYKIDGEMAPSFGGMVQEQAADEEASESFHGQLQDFQNRIHEYRQLEQHGAALDQVRECRAFLESDAAKIQGHISVYEKISRQGIELALRAGLPEDEIDQMLDEYLSSFDRLNIRGQELIRRRLEQHYLNLFFDMVNQSDDPASYRDKIEGISDQWDLKRTEVLSTPKDLVANLLSSYYFKINECHHCLVYTDKWVESYKKKIPAHVQSAIRSRYMLCGFELDRWDLINKRLEGLDELKSTEQTQFKSEVALNSFFKILNKVSNQTQKNNMFILLKAELMGLLQNNEKEQKVFEHFDLIDWLDRRDQRRSFSEKLRDFSA